MEKFKKRLCAAAVLLAAFVMWTMAVCTVDVQAIGPNGSEVGFAEINRFVHNLTGVHFALYAITDWMGLVPVFVCMAFGGLGLVQWIRRRSIRRVDRSILALGGFYIAVMAAYLFFEEFVVNYRPVLIGGFLEASYPSSTTMLVLCVMPAAMLQLRGRIRNRRRRAGVCGALAIFTGFMVVGRLVSGVHWFTDIVGGVLLSTGLVLLYHHFSAPGIR